VTDPALDSPTVHPEPRRRDGLPRRTTKVTRPKVTRAKASTAKATATATGGGDSTASAATAPVEGRTSLELARRIVELAEDKKAADIVLLDLSELTTVADCFVICSGNSERQLGAIADGIIGGLRDEKVRPFGREGTPASHWVLIDYGGVIVHVFTPPERDFYQLERHWAEAKTVLRVQ
jgi:ribosome-associated protein